MSYLDTNSFKKVRNYYKQRWIRKCFVCGTKKNINIHHLTYTTIGKEDEILDVVALCRKHHYLLHFKTGEKITKRDFEAVKELKRELFGKKPKETITERNLRYFGKKEDKHISIGKMKKLGLTIPMAEYKNGFKKFTENEEIKNAQKRYNDLQLIKNWQRKYGII
jgi:hypothetical protein